MTETADDLSAPLGQNNTRRRRGIPSIPWPPVIAGLLALPIAVFGTVVMLSSDPFGGEPMATAPATIAADATVTAETQRFHGRVGGCERRHHDRDDVAVAQDPLGRPRLDR